VTNGSSDKKTTTFAEGKQDHTSGLLSNLGTLATGAALFTGVLYVAGLLIVNIDLARYGLVNLDLAQTQYISVGGLWALYSTVALVGVAVGIVTPPRNIRESHALISDCLQHLAKRATPRN
jgi:hypothetical protein